jgi:hypothetical protein
MPRRSREPQRRRGDPKKLADVIPPPPAAPERASNGVRGRPFPKGNGLGRKFPKGVSGNPGGIPKDVQQFRELLQTRTLVGLARMDDILTHGTEEGIIKAVREIWANAWGRPSQPTEVSGPGGGPVRVKYDDVRQKLSQMATEALANKEDADGADSADQD